MLVFVSFKIAVAAPVFVGTRHPQIVARNRGLRCGKTTIENNFQAQMANIQFLLQESGKSIDLKPTVQMGTIQNHVGPN